jgi:hypothetical protein
MGPPASVAGDDVTGDEMSSQPATQPLSDSQGTASDLEEQNSMSMDDQVPVLGFLK